MDRPGKRLTSFLDWTEAGASALLLALVYFLVIAATIGLIWLIRNAPESFGTQAEWFYVGVGYIFLLGWAIGQTLAVIRRSRRRRRDEDDDDFRIPMPRIESGPSGMSIQWGTPQPPGSEPPKNTWSWNFQTPPTTFRVDDAQLSAAQAAAAAGQSWDDACRAINPQYDSLPEFERKLYQHAIRTALDERRRRGSS